MLVLAACGEDDEAVEPTTVPSTTQAPTTTTQPPATTTTEAHEPDSHGPTGRLLIGDGETGNMSIIDLVSGDLTQDAFDMGSRAGRIYATKSGRFAIAVASDANTVHIFDGGIYLEPHGDHMDLMNQAVKPLDIDLSGD